MELIAVNVGQEQSIQNGKTTETTGIFKIPTQTPMIVTENGIQGDAVVDKKHHGGVDQAVYVYGMADYDWWAAALGRKLVPGTFGDNLTISDLETAPLRIGDRLQVGAVLLEVTAPRIPCATLAARMGDSTFVKRFRAAERPGVYCRVIETGAVQAGNSVNVIPYQGETIGVGEMFRLYYEKDITEGDIKCILAAPIAIRARLDYEKKLGKLLAKQ